MLYNEEVAVVILPVLWIENRTSGLTTVSVSFSPPPPPPPSFPSSVPLSLPSSPSVDPSISRYLQLPLFKFLIPAAKYLIVSTKVSYFFHKSKVSFPKTKISFPPSREIILISFFTVHAYLKKNIGGAVGRAGRPGP